MRKSALFSAYNFGFFEIYGVSARTRRRGLNQCEHGGKVSFLQFCADVVYGQPLNHLLASHYKFITIFWANLVT